MSSIRKATKATRYVKQSLMEQHRMISETLVKGRDAIV